MILCIIVLAAAVRLAWIHEPQFHRGFLEEICSGLLIDAYLEKQEKKEVLVLFEYSMIDA